jgi:hypothetical protein
MNTNKNTCVISCPIDCYSGYSSRSRDLVKSIIESKNEEWDIKILPQRWGNCSWGFIEDNIEQWGFLKNYLLPQGPLTQQPDIWMQITVPNEFQPIGKYNIGITAGIETTLAHGSWIDGCNRMNLVLVSSKHSKDVLLNSKYNKVNPQTNQSEGILELKTPIEVLFEGTDVNIYKPITSTNKNINLKDIPESFCFLYTGAWLQGDIGQDRKNTGLLIKAFYETFKNHPSPPALILKTNGANSSYMDRREILRRINIIKSSVIAKTLPKIYLLHGDFTDEEINELYNNNKVKAMINLTKGEGFGRPLLEFSMVGKPIATSNWSGHLDFLSSENTFLIDGKLENVHPSALMENIIIPESQWFSPDTIQASTAMQDIFLNYKKWEKLAIKQRQYNSENYCWEKMKALVNVYFSKYIPELPKKVQLVLPKLKKIELPSLKTKEISLEEQK